MRATRRLKRQVRAETVAESEANWNCRACGLLITHLDEAAILFPQRMVGAVLRTFVQRWHRTCYEAQKAHMAKAVR